MSFKAYESSSAQKRLYIIDHLLGNSTLYNEMRVWTVKGNLDPERLKKAVEQISQRHESLRTSFLMKDGEVLQKVFDHIDVNFQYTREKMEISEPESGEIEAVIGDFLRPYDLGNAPLWQVDLVQLSENRQLILLVCHHIIADGISMDLIIGELAAVYMGVDLPELEIQYVDFATWQNDLFKDERLKKQEAYWLKVFEGEIPVLDIPTDFPRLLEPNIDGNSIDFEMEEELTAAVTKLAQQYRTSLYVILLAIFNVLLSKYSNQEDIVVGTPISGRSHKEFENIVGMFVNTLAMRNKPLRCKRFHEFLSEVSRNAFDAFENQDYQFEMLVENAAADRQINRNPIFDVMFALQNYSRDIDLSSRGHEDVVLVPCSFKSRASKFDMTIQTFEKGHRVVFNLEYRISLFRPETIHRFASHFLNLFRAITGNSNSILADIPIISVEEKEQLLYEFNDNTALFPENKSIHRLFEEQTAQTPDSTAIHMVHMNHLTYLELNKESDRWAAILMHKGIRPGTIAAVMTDRSLDMIIGIFAVLKAGGAYLPIDPAYPEGRIKYILTDSSAKRLLTHRSIAEKKSITRETILLDDRCADFGESITEATYNPPSTSNLAYIIYTSGSTGKPKGVAIRHRSAVNLLTALSRQYPLSVSDRYLLKTSFVFDVSVSELFGWFFGGGSLVILEKGTEKDPRKILNLIESASITHINFFPSGFGVFMDVLEPQIIGKLSTLKYIFLAGEALSPALVNRFRQMGSSIRLENLYGPTEGTVYASGYSLEQLVVQGNVPIGKPLPNVMLHILDASGHLQPVGVVGELCIAGEGVAEGYLNNPELTAEKFYRFDRFYRTYRTGDLARWLPDGNIEFLGRIDHQVKIRGFRIELGEVENQLLTHARIKEAVVLPGDMDLYAYIVVEKRDLSTLSVSELREYLSNQLPDYMIPSYFIDLERMPMTSGGKIDKEALRSQKNALDLHEEYTAPESDLEIIIADAWKDVLKIEKVGINDKFFERGGNSFNIVKLNSRLNQVLGEEIEVVTLFHYPTISSFANHLKQIRTEVSHGDQEAEKRKYEKSEELLMDSLSLFSEGA